MGPGGWPSKLESTLGKISQKILRFRGRLNLVSRRRMAIRILWPLHSARPQSNLGHHRVGGRGRMGRVERGVKKGGEEWVKSGAIRGVRNA